MEPHTNKHLILTIVLSLLIILSWQYFYKEPKNKEYKQRLAEFQTQVAAQQKEMAKEKLSQKEEISEPTTPAPRILIKTPRLTGSISLRGARLDDLVLKNYKERNTKNSPSVTLLSADKSDKHPVYFAEFGWLTKQTKLDLPNNNTLWKVESADTPLTPDQPITLQWKNKHNITFELEISVDNNYLFSIAKRIYNGSEKPIEVTPYGLVNREHPGQSNNINFVHEGPLSVSHNLLEEVSFKDMIETKNLEFDHGTEGGWLGFAEKYWFTAIIPSKTKPFQSKFSYYLQKLHHRYQVDYVGETLSIAPGEVKTDSLRFFAGSKKLSLLDNYAENFDIPLFDRAVDFGWLYFITKPIFSTLTTLHKFTGNFGLAILLLTIIIKTLLFPLAYKSYVSMHKLKQFHPQIVALRERYADNKLLLNKEIMGLYKREKINPASGCLPILIQIPIFFALYRVLNITIEMRHAPFFGWIKDLSAPDPTSIFNLFGLLPFEVAPVFQLGVWPLILGITMFLQQRMNPPPADPIQAKIFKLLPFLFTFILYRFAAGLVIYYSWSNLLTVFQQWIITRRLPKH